jgi:hypothetical protein
MQNYPDTIRLATPMNGIDFMNDEADEAQNPLDQRV